MTMQNVKYAGDELTLYALCRLYHQHAMVYTMTRMWTTAKYGVLLNESDLMGKCDIILLHLGGYRYGVLTKLECTKKRLKVKEIDTIRDELIHIRENTDKAHNTRPRKRLNYKDLSEGRSPIRPSRKQPYKPLPGLGPSELRMTAQDTIDKIRKSRVIGSVTIKTEEEKLKINCEQDSISSNTRRSKRKEPEPDKHCPRHCPKSKRMKTQKTLMDPNDMLPDLPAMDSVTTMDKPAEDISKPSKTNKTLTRSGVTELIATKETSADDIPGVNKQLDEPNIPT